MGSENPEFCQETVHAQKETKETRGAPPQGAPSFPELARPRSSTEIFTRNSGDQRRGTSFSRGKTKSGVAVSAQGIKFTQVTRFPGERLQATLLSLSEWLQTQVLLWKSN